MKAFIILLGISMSISVAESKPNCDSELSKVCLGKPIKECISKNPSKFSKVCLDELISKTWDIGKTDEFCVNELKKLCSGPDSPPNCFEEKKILLPSTCRDFFNGKNNKASGKKKAIIKDCLPELMKKCEPTNAAWEKDAKSAALKYQKCIEAKFMSASNKCHSSVGLSDKVKKDYEKAKSRPKTSKKKVKKIGN